MSKRYQILARKYRPQTFEEVVGQNTVVTTLKNAIRFEKIAHAYLFSGSRGVGKTTLARLFAKALNCPSLKENLDPCGECPSCLEIARGQSLDVIEIDGASNRGIDDIRQINETIGYSPSKGRYKIYIIDEVHMLTKEAFNALLKTLEEPPENVKFFFATTEPHKVLPTIISRCQRFDLARIDETLITDKLSAIVQDLKVDVEQDALMLIAKFSDGSLRDAESLLDQILCFSEGKISASTVRDNLGLAPKELFEELDLAFSSAHLPYAFELVQKLFKMGKDLSHFFEELIEHFRNIVSLKMQDPHAYPMYTQPQALYIFDLLLKKEPLFAKSFSLKIFLEATVLEIIRSKNRIPVEVLIRHLTENEAKLSPSLVEAPPQIEIAEKPLKKEPLLEPLKEAPPPILKKAEPPKEPLKKEPPPTLKPEPPAVSAPIQEPLKEELLEAPFNPFSLKLEPPQEKQVAPPLQEEISVQEKPSSHYDTLLQFTAVELEGTVKQSMRF